nr:aminotransferase class V-fold PLP-dependent enzyme [Kineosporia rhizophila]
MTGFDRAGCLLTTSTSAGLQQIAFGLRGADVLVSRDEFPANLYPWWHAQEAGLLTVRHVTRERPDVPVRMTANAVAEAITPSTTAVAVSAVDFRTGYRADLAALRDVIGERLLIVDGIQGFGVLDQDWQLADAVVVGGQKWLRAGWGAGFMALSERAVDQLEPILGGWTGVSDPGDYDGQPHTPAGGASQLSVTYASPFTSAALWAALELLESAGAPAVAKQVAESASLLTSGLRSADVEVLSPRDEENRAGIVVARVDQAASVRDRLAQEGFTATAHGSDRIRLSVHATTRAAAIEEVCRLLRN